MNQWTREFCRAHGFKISQKTQYFISDCKGDRKSTRLNSSHLVISYAVFCLKKKKKDVFDDNKINEVELILIDPSIDILYREYDNLNSLQHGFIYVISLCHH